jgi:hypothetical protein
MITGGRIGDYHWLESTPVRIIMPDVVRELSRHLIGLRAVNVSWDSGLLVPPDPATPHNWTFEQGRAMSPPIDETLASRWPYSDCGFDEWYFFQTLPADLSLSAYCNWGGASLADWRDLRGVPSGFDLQAQLERAQPVAVLGEGTRLFAIAGLPTLLDDFRTVLVSQ